MPVAPTLVHGGSGPDFLEQYFPGAPKPWLDLSTGINPWAYPHDGVPEAAWTTLPAPSLMRDCRESAASYFGVPPDNLAILPGSQAAISLAPRLFSPRRVAVLTPTYGEHAQCCRHAGHDVAPVTWDRIGDADEDILVVTNPNNPDGRTWSRAELTSIIARRGARWTVIDEAFADVEPALSVGALPHAIVLRSFGKFFGLAGVRLGFAIAPLEIVGRLEQMIGPWAVSGPALAIGARAYRDTAWQQATRAKLTASTRRLRNLLERHGLTRVGGCDLFSLYEHRHADRLFHELCESGIYVRRFADNPHWLRFGLPPDDDALARLERVVASL
jgi:cobalamin biosynthesis protein CobC